MSLTLQQHCKNIKEKDHKTLVAYVTAGLPYWKDCVDACIDAGADVVEVGLPFSDPIMDGPVIAQASAKALELGSKTSIILGEIGDSSFSVPIVVMTYSNVLYSHGLENISNELRDANIKGLIVPDISFENRAILANELEGKDIALIPLIASTTSESRSELIAKSAQGFIYCVAIKGITGQSQNIDIDFINPLNKFSQLPKYCGVGIRNAHDAKNVIKSCDGVIVGTAIVEKMLNSSNPVEEVSNVVKEIRVAIDS